MKCGDKYLFMKRSGSSACTVLPLSYRDKI